MILKHGTVTIRVVPGEEPEILVSDFAFKCDKDGNMLSCFAEAIKWAMIQIMNKKM